MKKFLLGTLAGIGLLAVVGFIFREPLMVKLEAVATSDMFLAEDADSYDPGLSVGTRFPQIYARNAAGPVSGINPFIADRGMIFIAVRSADW